jgi:acyl-CoA synthetase (AMP-forming)/AMP-acid ligase II
VADDSRGVLSNAAFDDLVRRYADHFAARGVGPGDVVAVKLPNRVELIVALFAAWRRGAALTPVNPALTEAETAYQLADSGARLMVVDSPDVPTGGRAAPVTVDELEAEPAAPGAADPHAGQPQDVALVVYTSGTTGRPKGVELTHANLDAMTASMIEAMRLTEQDHSLLVLPLFHVNGIVVSVLSPLRAGGQVTVLGRFSPKTFFAAMERARPTYFSGVPAVYAMLAALPAEVTPDTSSLRFVVCGAAPMPPHLIAVVEERFGVVLVEGYGLSEATCASTTNPVDGVRKPGTVGLPLPGQRVAIMDPSGELVTDGSAGEVVVAGPTVMRGYRGRPDETAATIRDGWLHTGDVGRLDPDGYLVLVDRIKDMIIRGGENIYPKEIEAALYEHPAVHEAAVVGRPHEVLGEVPVAVVSAREGAVLDEAALAAFLAERLAPYKRPAVVVVAEVPKNAVGKIDKPRLRREVTVPPPAGP